MTISSDIKLGIYNDALRRLGSRNLASIDENSESRRVLDEVWGGDDEVVRYALERGTWNFAIRAVEADYSAAVEPTFGLRRAFDKPDDFVLLVSLTSDAYFRRPLAHGEYVEEAGFWMADLDVLYIRYVSDGVDFGRNAALWSASFRKYLASIVAYESVERMINSTLKRDRAERDMLEALKVAKATDASGDGVKYLPQGSWSRSRVSRYNQ